MADTRFTETEEAILRVLADGQPHSKLELHACLTDPLANVTTIQRHISCIRRVLRPLGEEIICEFATRRCFYRWVRIMTRGSSRLYETAPDGRGPELGPTETTPAPLNAR